MMNRLLSLWNSPRPEMRKGTSQETFFRPRLEQLEEREVPSANPLDALLGSLPGVIPIQFNYASGGQANQHGQLNFVAQGQIGANPISIPLTLSATPGSNGAEILDLHLQPINLDLLGLKIHTSQICLDITAQPGSGNLLGNLLYNVAHALDTSTGNSSNPLGVLSPVENLLFSLETATLLNGGLNAVTATSSIGASSGASGDQVLPKGDHDILHLSLGPVNLNLLGLNVSLDNCHNGPVVVDVSTHPGDGQLLGNLLDSVANLLDPNQNNLGAEQLLGGLLNGVLTAI